MNIKIPDPNTKLENTAVIASIPGGGMIITTPAGQIAVTRSLARKLAIQMSALAVMSEDQSPIPVSNWPARKTVK